MNELPKVFAGPVQDGAGNNRSCAYEKHEDKVESSKDDRTIEQKIHAIFSSDHYIYKINVAIIRQGKKEEKRLVGYNRNYLITYDNEQIPIQDIQDIYLI